MILVFETNQSAHRCLEALNQVAAAWWVEQGYTVEQTENGPVLIGKNADTGEDNPQGITTTWDTLKESPIGTFYFASPSERYPTWREFMPDIDMGVEIEMPDEWLNNGE